MKNIFFTIYLNSEITTREEDLQLFELKIETFLVENIQPKLNRSLKMRKIMLFLTKDICSDNIAGFIDNFYNKKPLLNIINLEISINDLNWDIINSSKKVQFLIEKWKLLFENLSDDYYIVPKIEVLKCFDKLSH